MWLVFVYPARLHAGGELMMCIAPILLGDGHARYSWNEPGSRTRRCRYAWFRVTR